MQERSALPNARMYGAAISVGAQGKQWQRAEELFEQMQARGTQATDNQRRFFEDIVTWAPSQCHRLHRSSQKQAAEEGQKQPEEIGQKKFKESDAEE